MKILINLLVSGLAVFVTARLLPGVTVDSFGTALVVAVVLALVSVFLAPALLLLTLPLNILTLGLFTFVIIGGLVLLTARVVPGFQVTSFWWALVFALVLSVINAFFHGVKFP